LKDKEVKEKELKEKDFKETLSENGNGDDNEESEFLDQFTTHDTFLNDDSLNGKIGDKVGMDMEESFLMKY
jgi:hypothetical protein